MPGQGRRWVGVVLLLALAPLTAELLAAYLGDLGGVPGMLFLIVFFAPLYGGAALLVREVAVRRGLGWPGRLLLAAAFGVAMPTLVDVSLFTPRRDEIPYWDDIMAAATVGDLSAYAVLTWVGGHVVMSVAAPIVVAETIADRPGPWLGRLGLGLTPVGIVLVAALVHADAEAPPRTADGTDYVVSVAVVLALVGLALTRLGRPMTVVPGRRSGSVAACGTGAFVAMACFDLVPTSWLGVVLGLALAVGVGLVVLHWSRSASWSAAHVAALAMGALLARTCIGMLAPLPSGTTWSEKITQHVIYVALLLALGWVMARRTRAVPGDLRVLG